MVIGLPPHRHAEDARQHLGHAVVDRDRSEHERIASVLRQRLDAGLDLAIGREVLAVLELAHALVDEMSEIGNAIGNRRVDRIAAAVETALAQALRLARPAGGIADLGQRNEILQDLDLGLVLAIRDQNLDSFLEIQKPQRQLHIARRDDLRAFTKGRGILVVRIEQHDMRVGVLLQYRAQNERRGARFSRARRAEHREVLAQKVIDADHGGDRRILADAADPDRLGSVAGIGQLKLVLRRQADAIAQRRISRGTAIE